MGNIVLTKVGEEPEELVAEHGVVLVLVVELEDLHEVVDAAGVLGLLGLLEQGVEVCHHHDLLSLLLLAAQLVDGAQGGVQVARAEEVADVEAVHLAVTLEVIDVEGELDLCSFASWGKLCLGQALWVVAGGALMAADLGISFQQALGVIACH